MPQAIVRHALLAFLLTRKHRSMRCFEGSPLNQASAAETMYTEMRRS